MNISEIKGYGSGDRKAERKHYSAFYPVFSTDDLIVGIMIDKLYRVYFSMYSR